mgnify:CR=1 FL=1
MSRYDFIRFGGFVNWADEDTDTFRKMKVCLPVKEPVEDDTKIGLISTDEDNPEEIAVSYSVRAAELIPWTDSFQEGYWKALIVAEANGAGTDVLLPMLKDAGLCLMECVFLMLRSDACKLFPVLCRLFPEVVGKGCLLPFFAHTVDEFPHLVELSVGGCCQIRFCRCSCHDYSLLHIVMLSPETTIACRLENPV